MPTETQPESLKLIIHDREGPRVYPLGAEPITIGRSPENAVVLSDPRSSRQHLRIERGDNGEYKILDQRSQNGTFKNGQRIRSAPLRPGDSLVVGNTRITVEQGAPVAARPSAKTVGMPKPSSSFPPRTEEPTTASGSEVTQVRLATPSNPGDIEALAKRHHHIAELTRAINADPMADHLLDKIIDAAVELTGSERGFLILRGKTGMEFAAARAITQKDLAKPEFEVSWSIAIQVGNRGSSVLAVNAAEDPRFSKMESVENLGLRSVLCVPVRGHSKVAGVIYVDNRLHLGAYSAEDQTALQTLADQAGIALRNRKLMQDLVKKREEVLRLNEQLQAEVLEQGTELQEMRAALKSQDKKPPAGTALIGGSARMDELRHLIKKVAATDFPVLIHGESGTGKELVARAIHEESSRAKAPLVTVNCAAIPENLLENELFGHMPGAFTGADTRKQGLFQAADGGTLFMDEVSEMSSGMQSRLLRVLQEGEIRPVGGKSPISVNVRVIAASNRELSAMVSQGAFREDLYYRLRVLPVPVPPLRERREDIPDLIAHFFERSSPNGIGPRIAPDAMEVLTAYAWPGNVRELENEVKRLSVLAGAEVEKNSISRNILDAGEMLVGKDSDFRDLNLLVESIESREIQKALTRSKGNKTRAAELLGITRFTLQRKLDKYGILLD